MNQNLKETVKDTVEILVEGTLIGIGMLIMVTAGLYLARAVM